MERACRTERNCSLPATHVLRRKCQRAPSLRRVFGASCATGGKRHHANGDCRCQNCTRGRWRGCFCTSKAPLWNGPFATCVRPTALPWMYAKDVIDPRSSIPGSNRVLIVRSCEKEVVTKSGYIDKTVTLDDSQHSTGEARQEACEPDAEKQRATSQLRRRAARELQGQGLCGSLSSGVRAPGLRQQHHNDRQALPGHQNDTGCDTSRVLARAGIRTHHKPGRIQQLVKKADTSIMQYAASRRDNFENYIVKSWCPKPLRAKGGNNFETHPPTAETQVRELGLKGQQETKQIVSRPALARRPLDDTGLK